MTKSKKEYEYVINEKRNKVKLHIVTKTFDKDGELISEKEGPAIAGFKEIKKIKGKVIDWKGNDIKNKSTINVKLLVPHPREKVSEKEFDLDQLESEELYSYIKIEGAPKTYNIQELLDVFYEKEILQNKSNIIKIEIKDFSEIFGVNAKGDIILPDKYELLEKEYYEKDNLELEYFYKLFNKKELPNKQLKKIIDVLYDYLLNDDFNKIIFAYGLVSLFSLYLKEDKKMEMISYLGLISPTALKGKTASAHLLINMIILGINNNFKHSGDRLKGSIIRLLKLQGITAPLYIEEVSTFGDLIEIFKELATSSIYNTDRINGNSLNSKSIVIHRGSIIFSTNRLSKSIPNEFVDRTILLNFENRKEYPNLHKNYNYLKKNGHKLSKFIWSNLEELKSMIEVKSTLRENSNYEIIRIGLDLVNGLFAKFDKEPLTLDIDMYVNSKEELIATHNDIIKSIIYNEIKSITKKGQSKDIFSIPVLVQDIFNLTVWVDEYEQEWLLHHPNLKEAYDGHEARTNRNILRALELEYKAIIEEGEKYGLYINNQGLLITKKFLSHLSKKHPIHFKLIKTLPNLLTCFSKEDDIEYASSNGSIPVIGEVYGKDYEITKLKKYTCLFWKLDNEEGEINMEELKNDCINF